MSDVKDPKIKLFGKTIELPEISVPAAEAGGAATAESRKTPGVDSSNQNPTCSSSSMPENSNLNEGEAEDQESQQGLTGSKQDGTKTEDQTQTLALDGPKDSNTMAAVIKDLKTVSSDSNAGVVKPSNTLEEEEGEEEEEEEEEEEDSEPSNSQEKILKKPDKILPCPRCNSMDTKFCYFNNYNVKQPRHFCKACQRYWTAGGTMRNVPVGAGRRKNKSSMSQFRHLTVPEALQTACMNLVNGTHHPALNPNGTVLAFGPDSPLCESVSSVLNITEKTIRNNPRNGIHKPEENGADSLIGSSSSSIAKVSKTRLPESMPNHHPFPPQVHCLPGGSSWPMYPWNQVQWTSGTSPPAFGSSSFPVQFYPKGQAYWGCTIPGAWNVPWAIPPTTPTSSHGPTPPTSGPNSPTLGKHSRDDNVLKPSNTEEEEAEKESSSEKCLWVPKTLRIDDPGEAVRSSLWATLGIKNERADSVNGGGLFKAFQSQTKVEEKNYDREASAVLQANPAAFSRSLNFRERS